jgi:hypothetical protein
MASFLVTAGLAYFVTQVPCRLDSANSEMAVALIVRRSWLYIQPDIHHILGATSASSKVHL